MQRVITVLPFIVLCTFFSRSGLNLAGQTNRPVESTAGQYGVVISTARVDGLDSPSATLTIEGQNFGTLPRVFIGAPGGAFQQLFILQSTSTMIVASLNPVNAGTHVVMVQAGNLPSQTAAVDLTIGAVGPAGPTG